MAESRALALVLHDVAPASLELYSGFVAEVDRLGRVPLTLLVVPDLHGQGRVDGDRRFVAWIERRLAQGDEVVLHGYRHEDPGPVPLHPHHWLMRRVLTHEGEFYAVTEAEARRRLEAGLDLFARLGWPVRGFVPPGWVLGTEARRALQGTPLRYTSDASGLIDLPGLQKRRAPTLVWSARSAWRRGASRLWNLHRLHRSRQAPLLRLGVHPVDLLHRSVRRFWLRALEHLLSERTPLTKAGWLDSRAGATV